LLWISHEWAFLAAAVQFVLVHEVHLFLDFA